MGKTILFGEPMALLIADTTGPLEEVEHFTRAMSGAEVNVSIGLSRLGHPVEYPVSYTHLTLPTILRV